MERAKIIFSHLNRPEKIAGNSFQGVAFAETASLNDEDVVICSALRTPICKSNRGGFKDTLPDDLLSSVLTAVINDSTIDPKLIGDICIGNVHQTGAGAMIGRIAQFLSHIPETVPLYTINRYCGSGLQAVANIAESIKAGYIDVGLAAGVESMTLDSFGKDPGWVIHPRLREPDEKAREILVRPGIMSENVAEMYNIPREKQDKMAVESHAKAAKAQRKGLFDAEIVPVRTLIKDKDGNETPVVATTVKHPILDYICSIMSENVAEMYNIPREKQDKMAVESHAKAAKAQRKGLFDAEIVPVRTLIKDKDGNETPVVISKDDGVREGTTIDILAKLKPSFKPGGSTTAGNSSQISDGAAAVLLARRATANKYKLPVLGVFKSFAVAGVPPLVTGIGPAYAIPEALKLAGLTLEDIDIFEINEAFASQATYCVEKLGIPMEKVNPNGGAISLGHPLGCTGNRQVATLLHELKRRGKRAYGVISMCIGTGMGAAAVLEYPGP